MKVTIVIPARYASKRFPGKPLVDISGKPMIQHVYEKATESSFADEVIVATDDNRIQEAVHGFGGKVILTSRDHRSGTDRVAEIARNISSDIFINVQGDEPFISPKLIDQVASSLISNKQVEMVSARIQFLSVDEFLSPHNVKVICDKNDFALYFSREPIPFMRALWDDIKKWERFFERYTLKDIQRSGAKKHVGIYGYRRETLLKFAGSPQTVLERAEALEQLRALEQGIRIKMVTTVHASLSIDTPQDLEKIKIDSR